MTQDHIDRLAELAGGCRHPKWQVEDKYLHGMRGYRCPKCDEYIIVHENDILPAVGNGQWQPTLEGLIEIWEDTRIHKGQIRLNGRDKHWWAAIRLKRRPTQQWIKGKGSTPTEALAEAILKAAGEVE